MARLLLLCLKAVEPLVDAVGVKRGIAPAELPLDRIPLRDMEGDGDGTTGAGGIIAGGVIMLVECNMTGAWLEDKTAANVNEKISTSSTREGDMILSDSKFLRV